MEILHAEVTLGVILLHPDGGRGHKKRVRPVDWHQIFDLLHNNPQIALRRIHHRKKPLKGDCYEYNTTRWVTDPDEATSSYKLAQIFSRFSNGVAESVIDSVSWKSENGDDDICYGDVGDQIIHRRLHGLRPMDHGADEYITDEVRENENGEDDT